MNAGMDIRNLIEPEEHRKLAASFFNETWRLLSLTNRSNELDRQMIHCAHASRMHWELVGNFRNRAVGEWQIARVYSVLKFPQSALCHATECLAIAERAGMQGFPMGVAHEGMARALDHTFQGTAFCEMIVCDHSKLETTSSARDRRRGLLPCLARGRIGGKGFPSKINCPSDAQGS